MSFQPDCHEMYMEEGAGEGAADAVIRGILCLRERCRNLIVVTNDVFSESAEDSSEMGLYKETLGKINCVLAKEADQVTEVICGIPCAVKTETGPDGRKQMSGRQSAGRQKNRYTYRHEDHNRRGIQGKRSFAKRLYPDVEWTDGGRCALDEIRTCRALYHFHEFVKRWLRQGRGWEDPGSPHTGGKQRTYPDMR